MGATTFREIGYGSSAQEAFSALCEESREELGHQQGYSGGIHDTSLCANKTRHYKAAKNKDKFLDDLEENTSKRDTHVIELKAPKSNTNKIKSVVNINPFKGARKWETRYEVYNYRSDDDRAIASEKTQGAAIKKARAYTEKHQVKTYIEIAKVLLNGKTSIGYINYKESKTESQGKYLFVVCAPE